MDIDTNEQLIAFCQEALRIPSYSGRSAAAPGRMHRFLRNSSANSQLPNGPAESPAPTELRRIRTALQSSTAKLIYRSNSNAIICKSVEP